MGKVSFSVVRNKDSSIRHNDLIHPSLILPHLICRFKPSTIHHFSTKLFAAQWSAVTLHTRHKVSERECSSYDSKIAVAALKQCRFPVTKNNYYQWDFHCYVSVVKIPQVLQKGKPSSLHTQCHKKDTRSVRSPGRRTFLHKWMRSKN